MPSLDELNATVVDQAVQNMRLQQTNDTLAQIAGQQQARIIELERELEAKQVASELKAAQDASERAPSPSAREREPVE